jgi:hypothetical protein
MSEGWAERAVTVRRASTEEPLQSVFLPMESELWDPRRRRLTMLLDPGRIKRGLAPHEEAGYPLQEGDAVVVSVEGEWKDARGVALRGGAERLYEIGPAVRERIDPATWTVAAPPRAGSNAPLAVRFDRPLDRALLEHCLRVRDVPGAQTIGTEERSWGFVPDTPWRPGSHALAIDTRLEDLGGNSLGRVFDRDLSSSEDDPVPTGTSWVRFDIPARR